MPVAEMKKKELFSLESMLWSWENPSLVCFVRRK